MQSAPGSRINLHNYKCKLNSVVWIVDWGWIGVMDGVTSQHSGLGLRLKHSIRLITPFLEIAAARETSRQKFRSQLTLYAALYGVPANLCVF